MMPVPARTEIEQFRTTVTCHLGLQYEDSKLDYLADVIRQRVQFVGRTRFESYSAYLGHLSASPKGSAVDLTPSRGHIWTLGFRPRLFRALR